MVDWVLNQIYMHVVITVLLLLFFVPPGTSCLFKNTLLSSQYTSHHSIPLITVYLSLTHPYTQYFINLTRQIFQQQNRQKLILDRYNTN